MDKTKQVQKTIAKVISEDGTVLGSAFVAMPPDHLITCWHVVENFPSISIQFEGHTRPIAAEVVDELCNLEEDLAVLRISQPCNQGAFLSNDWKVGDSVWSYGYQYQEIVESGYPVTGRITGTTKIGESRQLIVVSGTDFQRGLSGAPLLNMENSSVIGVVHAYVRDKGVGMVVPIESALKNWTALSEHIHHNEIEAISNVASLFEILGYEAETLKALEGSQIVDVYGEIKIGFSTTRTVVKCLFSQGEITEEQIQDFIYRVCIPLTSQKRIENAFIVSVTNQPFTEKARTLAQSYGVRCVTFKELEANLINFSRYITTYISDFENYDQLAREQRYPIIDQIQWRDLNKYYVGLRYKNVLHDTDAGEMNVFIDNWLMDQSKKHLSILGDYGTGKTSSCLHLIHKIAREYQNEPSKSRIPLFFPLRDCGPQVSLRTFILEKLSQYHIVVNDYQAFEKMVIGGRLVLIFDGFDELAENTDEKTALARFREISALARGQAKILLTCRTHYFKSEDKSVDLLIAETMTPFMQELSQREEFSIIELQEFNDEQITTLITRHTDDPDTYWEDIKSTYNLGDLATRPILLTMILQTLPQLKEMRDKVDSTSLYSLYTKYWLEREKWRSVLSIEDKFGFAEQLAWQMFTQSKLSIHYDDLRIQIGAHFKGQYTSEQIAQTLDTDIRTSSFLARDKFGHFTFIHKSFMEFLVARKLAREIEEGQFENLGTKLIPHTILNFLKDQVSSTGILKIKEVATQSEKYSAEIRGTCMDILLLLGEIITDVPWIFSLSFNPDGTRIATGSADCKLRVWDLNATEKPIAVLETHESWVRTVHYSPRGDFLASSGWDGTVKVWSANDLSEVHNFQLGDKIVSVCFSPDGTRLAAGGFDKSIHVWDTASWKLLLSMKEHYGVVWDVGFSPDGKFIASASTDGIARVWDAETGKLITKLRGHNDGVSSVCFSVDGSTLFSGDWQGEVIAWDWKNNKIGFQINAHTNMIGELNIDPLDNYFVSCGDDLKIKVHNAETGSLVHVFSEPTDFLPSVHFSPDGNLLACGGYDQVLRIWNTQSWKLIEKLKQT